MTKIILNLIIATSIIACSNKQSPSPQGGQDSGGGNTTKSSLADVEHYYNLSYPVLSGVYSRFFSEDVIAKFTTTEKKSLLTQFKNAVAALESKGEKTIIATIPELDVVIKDSGFDVGIKYLISASDIIIRKESNCSSVDKRHAPASIKEFKIGSSICLSFKELSELPNGSLQREIIALLLHEYSHALGFNEEASMIIQKSFSENFDKIFPFGINFVFDESNDDSGLYTPVYTIIDTIKDLREMTRLKILSSEEWRVFCMRSHGMALAASHAKIVYGGLMNRFSSVEDTIGKDKLQKLSEDMVLTHKLLVEDSNKLVVECVDLKSKRVPKSMIEILDKLKILASKFQKNLDATLQVLEKYK